MADLATMKAAAASQGATAPPNYPGGPDAWVQAWYQNAVNAGSINANAGTTGGAGTPAQTGGKGVTPADVRANATKYGLSEDFQRFSDAEIQNMLNHSPYDPSTGKFTNNYGDKVDKPDERGPNTPANVNGTGDVGNYGAGGGGGGGGGGGSYNAAYSVGQPSSGGTAGAVPQFNAPVFTPPTPQDAFNDPGYQFALQQGLGGLQASAAAQGVLRSGGTLKGLEDYGQQAAAQQYQNVYNNALNTFNTNYQGAKDTFAPQYGAWQTQYGGDLQKYLQQQNAALSQWTTGQNADLSKYLQRENNIYGLINTPAPVAPTFTG